MLCTGVVDVTRVDEVGVKNRDCEAPQKHRSMGCGCSNEKLTRNVSV